MKTSRFLILAFFSILTLSSCSDDDDASAPKMDDELTITLRNTLEEDNPETAFPILFGEAEDAFDEIASFSDTETEFPTALAQEGVTFMGNTVDLSGLYSIDISNESIAFTLLPAADDPFWANVFGTFPEGKFDRYYLTYSEPHGITKAISNNASVRLDVRSETLVVVEISEGYVMQPGAAFNLTLNVDPVSLTNEQKAINFNLGLETADVSVLDWMRDDYIQHNLTVGNGKAALVPFYGGFGLKATVHRSFEAGDYVFSQSTIENFPEAGATSILFEVWRFENGFAVEHWDNFVPLQDDGDGTSQTDGVTEVTDLDKTAANKALLEEMAQTLFVVGDWTNVRDYFDIDNYVQHSVGSGADGAFLASLEGQTALSFYDDVKFVHVSGNFGIVASQGGDITGQDLDGDYAYYDLFRMEDGKIVEHWDAVTKIQDQSTWPHNNGKWGDDKIILKEGVNIMLRNSLQEDGGPETAFPVLFGQPEDAFDENAMLSLDGAEFATALAQPDPPINGDGLYRIDLTGNSIKFRLLPHAPGSFWPGIYGTFPAEKFDRYTFTFAEPHGVTGFTSNNGSVKLIFSDPNVLVVEISEGYELEEGISFNIALN